MKQQGLVLLPIVLILTVVAAIALLVNRQNHVAMQSAMGELAAQQIQKVAEAGLAAAKYELKTNGCEGYQTIANTDFAGKHYSVSFSPAASNNIVTWEGIDQDAYIVENNPGKNHGNAASLQVRNQSGNSRKALFRVDLSSVPNGAKILSAELYVNVEQTDASARLLIHRIEQSWSETTVDWDDINGAIQNNAYTYTMAPSSTMQWATFNITAWVRDWFSGARNNDGVAITAADSQSMIELTSTEATPGNYAPRVKIVYSTVGDGRVDVTSSTTNTLGFSYQLTRKGMPVYQEEPIRRVIQPDESQAFDSYIVGASNRRDDNHGHASSLQLDTVQDRRTVMKWRRDLVPSEATITSAKLQLFRYTASLVSDGVVNAHAITKPWDEGDGAWYPPDDRNVSYNHYDDERSWDTPGGDINNLVIDSDVIPDGAPDEAWMEWDLTRLFQHWHANMRRNNGVMLKAADSAAMEAVMFNSSNSDPPFAHQRPRLFLEYRCACGRPCEGISSLK